MIQSPFKTQSSVITAVGDLVRAGRGALVTFEQPGAPWLAVAGPNGVEEAGSLLYAAVPTLRLHRNGDSTPLVEAVANQEFTVGLHAIAEFARPLLGDEHPSLVALLAAVRDATADKRPRAPQVGRRVRETGQPHPAGFLSCLTLGDLQVAVERSRLVRSAA